MADEMMDKNPASTQMVSAEAGVAPADVRAAHDMAAFVQECPSMFHTVAAMRRRLRSLTRIASNLRHRIPIPRRTR